MRKNLHRYDRKPRYLIKYDSFNESTGHILYEDIKGVGYFRIIFDKELDIGIRLESRVARDPRDVQSITIL